METEHAVTSLFGTTYNGNVYPVNLDIIDKTVAQSVRSHITEICVLHSVTVLPTTVILSAAVNICQRQRQQKLSSL